MNQFLRFCSVLLAALICAVLAAAPGARGATDAGSPITIAIFPSGTPEPTVRDTKTSPSQALADQLNGLGWAHAWVVDSGHCPFSKCLVSAASLFIYVVSSEKSVTFTSFATGPSGVTKVGALPAQTVTSRSVDPLKPDQVKLLVGTVALDGQNKLTIVASAAPSPSPSPAFQGGLELVPNPIDQADPDYEPIMEHLLNRRGIAAVRSQFAGASAIGAPSDDKTCSRGQRYFVYRTRFQQHTYKLTGQTRLSAFSEGFLLDCTDPGRAATASGTSLSKLTTTAAVLPQLASFLQLAIVPKFAWKEIGLSATAFSTLVDRDPTSNEIRTATAAVSMQRLVDHLCFRLAEPKPTPAPSPTPSGGPDLSVNQRKQVDEMIEAAKNTSYAFGGVQGVAGGAGGHPVITLASFTASAPTPLICKDPLPEYRSVSDPNASPSAYAKLYNDWTHPAPSPSP